MLGFSQVLKPIKWQDLLEEGKNGRHGNAFQTGAKIYFSGKAYFGIRGTLIYHCLLIILCALLFKHSIPDLNPRKVNPQVSAETRFGT